VETCTSVSDSLSNADTFSTLASESDSDTEYQMRVNMKSALHVKLIFLDMDGPMAPWCRGRAHKWSSSEQLSEEPYLAHVSALRRIIDGVGGPDVVKIVISSNWRTDNRKCPWLVEQMKEHGIDVIGHTDVVQVHPARRSGSCLARDLEINRVLTTRILGQDGPIVDERGVNTFKRTYLPAEWEVKAWIAIDDLHLDAVSRDEYNSVRYMACQMKSDSDSEVHPGWLPFPTNVKESVHAWMSEFSTSHFVHVHSEAGLHMTTGAEALAIRLLNNDASV